MFAINDEVGSGGLSARIFDDAAGNVHAVLFCDDLGVIECAKGIEIEAAKFADDGGRFWAFERERSGAISEVFESDVVHDDEFVEGFDKALANHSVRNNEQTIVEGERFHFRHDAPLRAKQK